MRAGAGVRTRTVDPALSRAGEYAIPLVGGVLPGNRLNRRTPKGRNRGVTRERYRGDGAGGYRRDKAANGRTADEDGA